MLYLVLAIVASIAVGFGNSVLESATGFSANGFSLLVILPVGTILCSALPAAVGGFGLGALRPSFLMLIASAMVGGLLGVLSLYSFHAFELGRIWGSERWVWAAADISNLYDTIEIRSRSSTLKEAGESWPLLIWRDYIGAGIGGVFGALAGSGIREDFSGDHPNLREEKKARPARFQGTSSDDASADAALKQSRNRKTNSEESGQPVPNTLFSSAGDFIAIVGIMAASSGGSATKKRYVALEAIEMLVKAYPNLHLSEDQIEELLDTSISHSQNFDFDIAAIGKRLAFMSAAIARRGFTAATMIAYQSGDPSPEQLALLEQLGSAIGMRKQDIQEAVARTQRNSDLFKLIGDKRRENNDL